MRETCTAPVAKRVAAATAALLTAGMLTACTGVPNEPGSAYGAAAGSAAPAAETGIGKIKHVVIIMQENR